MTDFHFHGKIALVTGAGRGMGRTIAKALSAAGAVTYALSRTKTHLDSLVAECPNIRPVCADLTDWANTRKVVEALGPIDLLVNNAGVYHEQPFLEIDEQHLDSVMNTNVKPVVNVSQVVAKNLISRKSPGAIVNISSALAFKVGAHLASYSAAKAALDMMSRVMAAELGPHQIRVNIVNPGIVKTELSHHIDPKIMEGVLSKVALGKLSEPGDIANAVLFLLSDNAQMINGANVRVDGGFE